MTVFVNDKPLRFVDTYEAEQWKGNTESIFITEQDMTIENAIQELEETENHPGFIYMSTSPKVSWQVFVSYCNLIEASGGLVMKAPPPPKGGISPSIGQLPPLGGGGAEYLIILRHGKWDLPKGKMEGDETPELTAIREVQEECGINKLELIKPLTNTFHTYFLKGKRILKKTHWFLLKSSDKKTPTPQTDEDIQKAQWMTKQEIKETVLSNTYGAILELLKTVLSLQQQ